MYYDDSFHPTVEDDISVCSSSSFYSAESITNSIRKNQKKMVEESKRADKDYYSYYIRQNNSRMRIEMFSTSANIGSKIRDPMSGVRTNYRVGSTDEYTFFKVRMTNFANKDIVTLFYDSPEQYEKHHKCVLSQSTKEQWYSKRIINSYTYPIEEPVLQTIIH